MNTHKLEEDIRTLFNMAQLHGTVFRGGEFEEIRFKYDRPDDIDVFWRIAKALSSPERETR